MSLAAIQIVISDEPLLLMEACDRIIQQARADGVYERKVIDVVDKLNWNELLVDSGSMSLFAETKLTDIRFNKVPVKAAQEALAELIAHADADNIYLIRLPKLDKRQKATKWFKAISQKAKVDELWPPKAHEFLGWIQQRAQSLSLQLTSEAAQMLAEQTEGNLLAADQSLRKLELLYSGESIDLAKMRSVTSDNARYSVFLCLDEALAGKGERAVKMLKKFQQENIAPISILVNLTREIDLCKNTALASLQGINAMQALSKSYLWDSKKRIIAAAVGRLPVAVWQRLMVRCAYMDRMIKGQESGDIWLELELCLWMLAGTRIWGR